MKISNLTLFLSSMVAVCISVHAQNAKADPTPTRYPANIRYLTKLIGVSSDSAKARIQKGGFEQRNVSSKGDGRDKVLYVEFKGKTAEGRYIEFGYNEKSGLVVSASYNAFKREYQDRIIDSLTTLGYKYKIGETEAEGFFTMTWKLKDNMTLYTERRGASFYLMEVMTEEEAKKRRL